MQVLRSLLEAAFDQTKLLFCSCTTFSLYLLSFLNPEELTQFKAYQSMSSSILYTFHHNIAGIHLPATQDTTHASAQLGAANSVNFMRPYTILIALVRSSHCNYHCTCFVDVQSHVGANASTIGGAASHQGLAPSGAN